jgi:two-component system, NarL family, sensor histidine kinase UhpB
MDQGVIEDVCARHLRQRLHDGLGQNLSLAAMQIDQAMAATGLETLRRARLLLRDALDEVRSLIDSIGDVSEEPASDLAFMMLACVRRLNAQQAVPVDCTIEGPSPAMPAQACDILLHATQELLVNACKHGRADRVEARLSALPHRLSITVTQHHHGVDVAALASHAAPLGLGLGLGLRTMHRGLDRIGARLRWRNGGPDCVQARISWMPR